MEETIDLFSQLTFQTVITDYQVSPLIGNSNEFPLGTSQSLTEPLLSLNSLSIIDGTSNNDILRGDNSNNTIFGFNGQDELFGGNGDDSLDGGDGDDKLLGQDGNDILVGGSGQDELQGGLGDDSLDGGDGDDKLFGQEGSDALFGGQGQDQLNGGVGNDFLNGGSGDNTLTGGADSDTFVVSRAGKNRITDFEDGVDFLVLEGGLTFDQIRIFEQNSETWITTQDNQPLAFLTGINPSQITATDFLNAVDRAGNTPDQAQRFNPSSTGKTVRDYVDSADPVDFYSFSLGAENEFSLLLDGLAADANVAVLDLDGNVVTSSSNSGRTAESINTTLDTGAYRIQVTSASNFGTPYNLTVSLDPLIEGITTGGSEVPVFLTTAQSLPLINVDDFRSGDPVLGSDPRFAGIDGSGFSTVIIDTGINLNHPYFGADSNGDGVSDRIVYDQDFADDDLDATDVDGHGTNVSSIAAANDTIAGDGGDFTGMAPGANVISLKVFRDGSKTFDFGDAEQALQWVVDNAERFNIASVNMSLGDGENHSTAQTLYSIDDELAALAARGVIVVSASGNDYFLTPGQGTQGVAYPSADPNSLSIGAVWDANNGGPFNWVNGAIDNTTNADRITSFSQRHSTLTTVFAPGAQITGAGLNDTPGNPGFISTSPGTSQAAPHVAGMAALAQQLAQQELNRQLTPAEFRQLLINTGTPIFDGDQDGDGMIDPGDEDDNVTNTGLTFQRIDMLALANGILNLRPPGNGNIDLSGTQFDVAQPTLNTGDNLNVNFQIQNTGLDAAGSFNVNFYLSENNIITQNDFLLGSFTVNSLAGNSNTGLLSQTLTLPRPDNPIWSSFGSGNGNIGMIVDEFNTVGETNENNNSNIGQFRDFDSVQLNQQGQLTATVNRVRGDFDNDIWPTTDASDFYTILSIAGNEWRSGTRGGSDDLRPNWQFSQSVTATTVPITIKIYDEDGGANGADDHVDIDPNSGDKDLNLTYNLFTGQITGDVSGTQGQQLYARGRGDSDQGEVWFTLNFQPTA